MTHERRHAARKPQGYWSEFANLERELRAFIAEHGDPDRLPGTPELVRARRFDLINAIALHGGRHAVGERLGLACAPRRRRRGYWSSPEAVERELLAFVAAHGLQGTMPTGRQLIDGGCPDLLQAIQRRAGGLKAIARRLGLERPAPPATPSAIGGFEDFERELRAFVDGRGQPGVMPSAPELKAAGRRDLFRAVQKHGGVQVVAARLGLRAQYPRQQVGYWRQPGAFERELRAFIREQGMPDVMPTCQQLLGAGRTDLVHQIQRHGGFKAVAAQLHLTRKRRRAR